MAPMHLVRLSVLLLVCLVPLGCRRGVAPPPEGRPFSVIMITDEAGIDDHGFNACCWAGAEAAEEDLGVKVAFKEPHEPGNYEAYLDAAATEADVVVSLGFGICPAVEKVAARHPNTRFVQIEGAVANPPANLQVYNFRSEDGGFLAGVVAALFTRSGKVGVVAGRMFDPVKAYAAGFEAGVKTVNENMGKSVAVEVLVAGDFNDPAKGRQLAEQLIAGGCDVLFRIAGNTGQGVLAAAKANDKVFLIGEDLDIDDEIPGRVLTSALKRMDDAVYQGIVEAQEGKFRGGNFLLGAPEGFMDITDMRHTRKLLPPESLRLLDAARNLLLKGEITVPATEDAVKSWKPPTLK